MSEWPKQVRISLMPGEPKRGQWVRGIWRPLLHKGVTDGSFGYEVFLDGPDDASGAPSKSEKLHSRVYITEPSQQEICLDVVRRAEEYGH